MSAAPDPSGHRLVLGDASELVAGVLRAAAERRRRGGSSAIVASRGAPAGLPGWPTGRSPAELDGFWERCSSHFAPGWT
ncbi:MAG: hypothetical protein ACRDI1_07305, partial [Actinomycetota bacterium]